MRTIKKLLVTIALIAAVALPSSAQFRFGIKAGLAVNNMKFSQEMFNAENRTGFTGGIMTEFTVPIVNLGFDASVLYARRSVEFATDKAGTTVTDNRNYIDIPVNLKWKIGLPIVGKVVTPFITTGPDFSFLISGKSINEVWENHKFDCAWTVGAGLQFFNHLQIAANYGFGLTKTVSGNESLYSGKDRSWTVTAAFLF